MSYCNCAWVVLFGLFVGVQCFGNSTEDLLIVPKTDLSESSRTVLSEINITRSEINLNGNAIETCNETQTCRNGGSCLNHICVCLPGTYGPFCENIYDCLQTDMCETHRNMECSYDVDRQAAYCRCYTSEDRFDEATKSCKSCLCTPWGRQNLGSFSYCEYQQGQKVCVCTEKYGYNPTSKVCEFCDCGANSTWCAFDENGRKVCGCQEGYFFDNFKCTKCLCGSHGTCDQKIVYPSCICDEGYDVHRGVCVECKCGKYGTCLFDDNGKQLGCKCQAGYAEKLGKCEKCYCGDNINCTFEGKTKICGCELGYDDVNGFCRDINECERHNPCNESMTCINLVGSYECVCKDGYVPVRDDKVITKPIEFCQDIDECQNSSACALPNTFCENMKGSYKCICKAGFVSRGMLGSNPLCEESETTSIYIFIAIASFVCLIIIGAVVFYIKRTFQGRYFSYHQEMK